MSFLTPLKSSVPAINVLGYRYGPVAVVAGIVFVIAVYLHRRPFRLAPRIRMRQRLATEGQARIDGQWASIADSGDDFVAIHQPMNGQESGRSEQGLSPHQLLSRVGLWRAVGEGSRSSSLRDRLRIHRAAGRSG